MLTATLALTVVVFALLAERTLERRSFAGERETLRLEREALRIEAQDERRELLTRLQHPQLIVSKAPENQQVPLPVEDDADEWAKVGTVQPAVDVEDEPGPDA